MSSLKAKRQFPKLSFPIGKSMQPDSNSPAAAVNLPSSFVSIDSTMTDFINLSEPPNHLLHTSTLHTHPDPATQPQQQQSPSLATATPPPRRPRPHPIDFVLQSHNEKANSLERSVSESNLDDSSLDIKESDLVKIDELGTGSGGTVFKMLHMVTNTVIAMKVISLLDEASSAQILREIQIMKKCNSSNIISFYSAHSLDGDLSIFMEYMDVGSLEKIVKLGGKTPEAILRKITMEAVNGLVYLYETHRILHRDIKPSNILVNSKGKVKLCDFGVSGQVTNSLANTFVGTGAYMSPERIQGGKYSAQSDTWSLGLTVLEMALGHFPFESQQASLHDENVMQLSVFELLHHITNDPSPTLPATSEYSAIFRDFINCTLLKDAMARPTPLQLLQHPFIVAATREKVDFVGWIRSFITGLNETQIQRWSISQKLKRKSLLNVIEKRRRSSIYTRSMTDGVSVMTLGVGESRLLPTVLDSD